MKELKHVDVFNRIHKACVIAAFDTCIRHGSVPGVLREAALNFGAQLVVIGRGHATKFLGRFRTNVNAIIRESPCPVLSI